jgi:hypothetical protein
MLPVLAISSVVLGLILVLLVTAVFWRTAAGGERGLTEGAQAEANWRPPFIDGEALRTWAAATAERIAAKRLTGRRTAKTPGQLVDELEEGAAHAMLPLARQAELERIVPCPETGQGEIGVTAPEALAIAEYLHTHLPRTDQKRIMVMAYENASKRSLMRKGELDPAPLPCPLAADDNVCCAYAVRPIQCEAMHAIAVAKSMSDRAAQGPVASQAESDRHEIAVEQGIESGLTRALRAAGLESEIYELNSALAAAMDTPCAAERWANGERIFAGCMVCPPPTPADSR